MKHIYYFQLLGTIAFLTLISFQVSTDDFHSEDMEFVQMIEFENSQEKETGEKVKIIEEYIFNTGDSFYSLIHVSSPMFAQISRIPPAPGTAIPNPPPDGV